MKRMKKVDIIARAEQLEDLKEALNRIGIQGMTVSQVFGCGLQKGHTEVYRGQEYAVNLIPMVKVETVVCDVPVDLVMDTARYLANWRGRGRQDFRVRRRRFHAD